uniref:BTB domain-containing protein n=1 Tax=Aegilops tauschii subsp. strangulata TaxID=200361 RepID=A0A453SKS4_AEGTS
DSTKRLASPLRQPPSDLHRHFGDLRETMDGADVTFLVRGDKFSAHRLVLAARSPVFKAELFGSMKEKDDNLVEIHEMEAHVFKCLLYFIYTDTLPALEMGSLDVTMASHLLVAADRYNIERLKLSKHKLCNHIHAGMVATSLVLAKQHTCHGLKKACLQFLASPSNLRTMMASDGYEHLKSSCPSVLRELIARPIPIPLEAAKDIILAILVVWLDRRS